MNSNQTTGGQRIVAGMAWMLLSSVLFVGVTGIVRHLGSDMSAPQAAFIRYAFGMALMFPFLIRIKERIEDPSRILLEI